MAALPRVFTIPPSAPFLKVLIQSLLDGKLIDGFAPRAEPLALASLTLFLPTRRACRAARDTFLEILGDAAILPRIVPIGDVDEDELIFSQAATGALAELALELPEALAPLDRRLLLAQLIAQWANAAGLRAAGGTPLVANTPAATLELADALARLIDDMTTRRVSWDRLDTLVPDELDVYWQNTLEFLKIARVFWPERLRELERIDAAERRDRLIAAEIARLQSAKLPVIAAGSTGSMPTTADLLAAISKLPQGAVVLPGLDMHLDAASWAALGGDSEAKPHEGGMPASAHPQFALHGLLKRIGIERRDVVELVVPAAHGREEFLSEALRPAITTDLWTTWIQAGRKDKTRADVLKNVTVIEARSSEEEALAIAVALREALETPDKTAALITPDRTLARRVIAALDRWNIRADDSGGDSLADATAGIFARLVSEAALNGAEPVTLLALLKHAMFRLGRHELADRQAIELLEFALLRGPRPKSGSHNLHEALQSLRAGLRDGSIHRSDPRHMLTESQFLAIDALIARVHAALQPLESMRNAPASFADLARAHRDCIEHFGRDADDNIAPFLGHGGKELARAFDDILASPHAQALMVVPRDYTELFQASIADRNARKSESPGVRIRVFGPLEARLQHVDRVVLAGLVEGTWPPETRTDAWLNRPMRHAIGLDAPERRIGLAAHDFAQAMGTPEVFLTRATKSGGAPTVMSRFLQRLAALAGSDWDAARKRGEHYLHWTQTLDRPAHPPEPIKQPQPSPPRAYRPKRLSVTEIEHWLRDPYSIYAKHILKLYPLEAVDTPPGYADRGTLIHGAVAEFTERFAEALPEDAAAELLAIGAQKFKPMQDYPEAQAFWWPRFRRIAQWFVDWDKAQRGEIAKLYAEIKGELQIPRKGEETPFTLTTRADRIEHIGGNAYRIVDYKTGSVPSAKQVMVGLAPQLSLETAILQRGGFEKIPAGSSVTGLAFIKLSGARPAGKPVRIETKDTTPDEVADRAYEKLVALVTKFDNDTQAYRSMVSPMWTTRYGDYDHLARVKEWTVQLDEGESYE